MMNKPLSNLIKGTAAMLLLSATTAFGSGWTIETIQKKYPVDIQKTEVKNGLIVHQGVLVDGKSKGKKVQFFVTQNKESIIFGSAYDSDGNEISIPADMTKYHGKEAFVYGNGKEHYYVWTDPECPYCIKFEQKMEMLKDKGTFHVYFFPLSFHKNAMAMSTYVLGHKNDEEKAAALFETTKNASGWKKATYTATQLEKLEKEVQSQMDLGVEMGVTGTPSIFNSSGQKINWTAL